MKKFIYICILFFIASCAGNTRGTWSCPILEGGKGSCISIQDAALSFNENSASKSLVDFANSNQKIEINLIAPKFKDLKKIKQEEFGSENYKQASQNSKLRTSEKVGRVWFAPYIDSEGNQHSEKVIHVVDEEAKWVGQR